jgi:transposase InsO family protein
MLCSIAKVSRSGYYGWLKDAGKTPRDYDDYLLIKKVFDRGKSKWGWRTLSMKLEREESTIFNHKKIKRIMRKYGLNCKVRRKNPYKAIMKKTQEHRTFVNVLNREFKQCVPGKVFGTDITYIPHNHRFAYLAIVKDMASGEIVSWHLSLYITMELVLTMLRKLPPHAGTLIHSDQGFHYTNPAYIHEVKLREMVQSMSRKANCIDNAPVESFFGHLKDEVDYRSCQVFGQLYQLIKKYIYYYNHERSQWLKNKMTPVEYRDHLLARSAA